MGFLQPVTNLRDYFSQNPPVVTFFLCLLTLAVSFICLSSYSYTHIVPNPDTTKVSTHLCKLHKVSACFLCVLWINQASGDVMFYHAILSLYL